MPDTQKKVEEFVEENDCECGDGEHSIEGIIRRAIKFGLLLSCEAGPEKTTPKQDTRTFMGEAYWEDCCGEGERSGWDEALTQRDEAVREMAARVGKG